MTLPEGPDEHPIEHRIDRERLTVAVDPLAQRVGQRGAAFARQAADRVLGRRRVGVVPGGDGLDVITRGHGVVEAPDRDPVAIDLQGIEEVVDVGLGHDLGVLAPRVAGRRAHGVHRARQVDEDGSVATTVERGITLVGQLVGDGSWKLGRIGSIERVHVARSGAPCRGQHEDGDEPVVSHASCLWDGDERPEGLPSSRHLHRNVKPYVMTSPRVHCTSPVMGHVRYFRPWSLVVSLPRS
jgi:hypothetical protein